MDETRSSPFLPLSRFRVLYILNANRRTKNEGGLGTRLNLTTVIFFSFPNASESELHLFRLLAHAVHHLPTIVYIDIHDFYKIKQYSIKYNIKNSLSTTKMQKFLSHVTVLKIRIAKLHTSSKQQQNQWSNFTSSVVLVAI